MAIIEKERTKFKVIYFDDSFKECSSLFDTEDMALKMIDKIRNLCPVPFEVNGQTKFCDYLDRYIDIVIAKSKSHHTLSSYKSLTNNYIKKCIENLVLDDLNEEKCICIINQIEKLPINHHSTTKTEPYLSSETFQRCCRILKAAIHYLYVNNIIDEDYLKSIKISRRTNSHANKSNWTITLFEEMMEKCNDKKMFIFLHLLFSTGLSVKEIRALEVCDIHITDKFLNHDECFIESRNCLERINEDSLPFVKNQIIEVFDSKIKSKQKTKLVLTGKNRSTKIFLPNSLAKILLEYVNYIRYFHHKCETRHQLLFIDENGKPIDDRTLYKKFEAIRPSKDFTFQNLSAFGSSMAKFTIGNIYYYQLDDELYLPDSKKIQLQTQEHDIKIDRIKSSFIDNVILNIPGKEAANVKLFIKFLDEHKEFKIELLHQLKEVI